MPHSPFSLSLRNAIAVVACACAFACSVPEGPHLEIAQAHERAIPGLNYGDAIGLRGQVSMHDADDPQTIIRKEFVLRHPRRIENWNRVLVIGAHGGQGGKRFDANGEEIGVDDTALDDVVGDFVLNRGFAYASLDRNGVGGTRMGEALTESFTRLMVDQAKRRLLGEPDHVLLVGFSMGGGIARRAAESEDSPYSGVLAIAGAGGDLVGGTLRRIRLAELWPGVDPSRQEDIDPVKEQEYAQAVGTPVAAKRFWPFVGASSSLERVRASLDGFGYAALSDGELRALSAERLAENEQAFARLKRSDSAGCPRVPFIEVVGTFDDFVLPEIRRYRRKVEEQDAADLHRLYEVEGAWHISREDDAVGSFQWVGTQMGLNPQAVKAMATGEAYIPVVQTSLLFLDRWVREGEAPPTSVNFASDPKDSTAHEQ